jgi:hypothetical protein
MTDGWWPTSPDVPQSAGAASPHSSIALWWWLSVPYSVLFPAIMMLFGVSGWTVAHVFLPFLVLAAGASLSAALWAGMVVYQIWKRKTRVDVKTGVMLFLSVVGALWWFIPA